MRNIEDEYRQFLRDTCWYKHAGENSSGELAYLALGVAGETGEFVDEVKKIVRDTGFDNLEAFLERASLVETRIKLAKELGDIEWYITRVLDVLGFLREDILLLNTFKLFGRLLEKGHDIKWPYTDPEYTLEKVDHRLQALGLVPRGTQHVR